MKKLIASGFIGALLGIVGLSLMGPRDGNGNYSLPAGNPVVSGTPISSSWANATLSDLATAMAGSIAKDGQTVPTANLPMGGFRHTGVADATARNNYASAGQIQDGSLLKLGTVSGTNTITGNLTPAITSYAAGSLITFTPAGNNTGATTLNVNGVGALDVLKADGDALVSGDLVSGTPALLVLDSGADDWILLNPQASLIGIALSDFARVSQVNNFVTGQTINSNTVWHAGNDGSGSGLDADVLDGMNATDTASASTIAARSSGGYLFATYFNQSSSESEVGTPTQVFVQNGSDGYLRKSSLAQLQDDLTTRNISGKAGITKNLVSNASCPPSASGEDGRITYCY